MPGEGQSPGLIVCMSNVTAVNEVGGRPQRQQVMVQGSNVKVIAKLLEGILFLPIVDHSVCMLREDRTVTYTSQYLKTHMPKE